MNNRIYKKLPLSLFKKRSIVEFEVEIGEEMLKGFVIKVETGRCFQGPCVGEFLKKLPLVIREKDVLVVLGGKGQKGE